MGRAALKAIGRDDGCIVVGLAFLWSYFTVDSYPNAWFSDAAELFGQSMATTFENLYSVMQCGLFVLLLVTGGLLGWSFAQRRSIVAATGVIGLAGMGLLQAGDSLPFVPPAAVAVGGLALTAIFLSVMVMAWGVRSSQGDPCRIGLDVALSFALYAVMLVAFTPLPFDVSCLAPVVVPLTLVLADDEDVSLPALRRESFTRLPWGFILAATVLIYALIWLLDGLIGANLDLDSTNVLLSSWAGRNAVIAFVLIVSVLIALPIVKSLDEPKTLAFLFVALFILCCVVLLVTYFFPETLYAVTGSKFSLRMFVWIALACTVSRLGLSPYPAFAAYGLMLVAFYHSLVMSVSVGQGFWYDLLQLENASDVLAVMLFLAVVAGSVLLLYWYMRDKAGGGAASDGDAPGDDAQPAQPAQAAQAADSDPVEARCRSAFEGCGLTPREFDVAVLTYRGYSARRIGDVLFLAEPTVRGHLTHIYQKLGVRNKQELIDRVDADDQRSA